MCKMENKTIQINYKSCAMSELSKEDADLVAAAQKLLIQAMHLIQILV